MIDPLLELERTGALSAVDVELARALARIAHESEPSVLLALALASRAVQEGHVCLDLARRTGTPLLAELGEAAAPWPAPAEWTRALARSRLVHVAGTPHEEPRPLTLDAEGRVYLTRYYDHEVRVSKHVLRLAQGSLTAPALPAGLLDALFAPREDGATDLQRTAALESRTRRFSVIVGGPGTGKTSTVVKLLALLAHDALGQGREPPRVLLTAPTGKAAQRLSESIERARDKLPVEPAIKQAIRSEAVTVHRALGSLGGSLTRFRHRPEHPLDCDVLLLDEASMVDLALMRRLLDAVPDHARVIMLGDPDQLASVEAGGVLGDLCTAATLTRGPLARCVSRLTESYRYPAHSGIARLAKAVHAQDPEATLSVLRAGHEDVSFHGPLPRAGLGRALETEVRTRYRGLRDSALDTQLATLDAFRVLAAHRKGHEGVESLNLAIARVVRGRSVRAHESYPGRPILITQNDYASNLFNGDVGVMHSEKRGRALNACFRLTQERVRHVALGRLPSHESVYAMTVHKSQGSEFASLAIVLPERPSPVLTRELLYTAITRAKSSVSVYASQVSLEAALKQRVERNSGLVCRLTES